MKNLYQDSSKYMDYTNATGHDIVSGQIVPIEATNKTFIGIATDAIKNGAKGVLLVSDAVVKVGKEASGAIAVGVAPILHSAGKTIQAVGTATNTLSNAYLWTTAADGSTEAYIALR